VKFLIVVEVDTADSPAFHDPDLSLAEWMDALQDEYGHVGSLLIDLLDYPTTAVVSLERGTDTLERAWQIPGPPVVVESEVIPMPLPRNPS
jgi:hypothetical protein